MRYYLLRLFRFLLRLIKKPPRKPKRLKVFLQGENIMGLLYKVGLPPVEDHDVVAKKLRVFVNDVESVYELGGDVFEHTLSPIPHGSIVSIMVAHIDDAGNESDWSKVYTFDAKDTIRPYMPGPVSVVLLEEVADAVAEPVEPLLDTPLEPTPGIPTVEDTVDLPPDHPVDFGI
jgi:hypothetical protein